MTSTGAIEGWLRKRFAQEASVSVFMGVMAIALGFLVVFLTFWLAYAMMWTIGYALSALTELVAARRFPWPHGLRMLGAAGFIVLLFARHLKTSPWDRGIDGLVFLEKGISLTEELRSELRPLFTGQY